MELPLLVTTLISIILFIPFIYYLNKKEGSEVNNLTSVFTGGAAWAVYAAVIFLPSLLLYNSSNINSYAKTIVENRTGLFWLLIVFILLSEVIRFLAVKRLKFFNGSKQFAVLFGLGWGISEIFTRFAFFFDDSFSFFEILIFFLLIIAMNVGLALVLIRAVQNTKYFIFSVFMKLQIELGIYGSLGYKIGSTETLLALFGIAFLEGILIFVTLITMDYKLED